MNPGQLFLIFIGSLFGTGFLVFVLLAIALAYLINNLIDWVRED